MKKATLSVKLNNEIGPCFQSAKGVKQGDPLSPFLFNIAADTHAKMLKMTHQNKVLTPLVPQHVENGIVALYVDDTIVCLQDDKDMALNLKLVLYLYEAMSGLKINFNEVRF